MEIVIPKETFKLNAENYGSVTPTLKLTRYDNSSFHIYNFSTKHKKPNLENYSQGSLDKLHFREKIPPGSIISGKHENTLSNAASNENILPTYRH